MRKTNRSSILQKETINKAAEYFLLSEQQVKNKNIDMMLEEQPNLITFFKQVDKDHASEVNKEIIIQLIAIIYTAFRFQKIKVKKIKISKIWKSLDKNSEMKTYFNNDKFDFDENKFNEFWKDYKQKNILTYTYFAINHQFIEHIEEERDGIFIFYTVKTISDAIADSI